MRKNDLYALLLIMAFIGLLMIAWTYTIKWNTKKLQDSQLDAWDMATDSQWVKTVVLDLNGDTLCTDSTLQGIPRIRK